MKEDVYLIPVEDELPDKVIAARLKALLIEKDLLGFVSPRDLVAVKTHFGEKHTRGYVRPVNLRAIGQVVRKAGGMPFLTETSTLYKGQRSNAVAHLEMAREHGFTMDKTGMPVIMADGLLGDEEIEVNVSGQHHHSVMIAAQIVKCHGLVLVSHFTGHLLAGFGGALKNLGMGCASRRGKLVQHSTVSPVIKKEVCTGCGECVRWCPRDAVALKNGTAFIDADRCIGCGECLAVCRFDAVGYNWSMPHDTLQEKIVEHAMGVMNSKKSKTLCITYLTRISRDCDCMKGYEKVIPDIGVLVSADPVAIDAAALDLVEKQAGKPLNELAHRVPCRTQLEHSKRLGFGNTAYRLITWTSV